MKAPPTYHATALLLGATGVLIRGPSSSGKSLLAATLLREWQRTGFGRLVADDQVCLTVCHGRLIASPPPRLAGALELRGRGIIAIAGEPACIIRLLVDIVSDDALERLPEVSALRGEMLGLRLPRQPVPSDIPLASALIRQGLLVANSEKKLEFGFNNGL